MLASVKGLAVVFLGVVFAAGFGVWPRQKTALSLVVVLAGNLAFRSRGYPALPRTKPAHSVPWFLAPWVSLVQGVGSGHSALGAKISNRVNGP